MENEICKKKTTAPDTSVGADDGLPLHNSTENGISTFEQEINGDFQNSAESLDEIYRKMQRLTDPHYLHTISMSELYQTVYQSRPPVIDGLLYSGAYTLAGAPKIGKSFLEAQIAYHVSTGEALWGYEVHPGTVLYLSLEDDFQRIQNQMFMMYGVNDTDRLHFATAVGKIGNGLDEQLENFVREHPDLCRRTDDDELGGLTFEIDRRRFAVRLTAPYSEDHRQAASELSKKNGLKGRV